MISLRQPRRTRHDDIVPMINVAFLLLVFFLMSAVIAPRAPLDIAAPSTSQSSGTVERFRLFVAPDGALVDEDGLAVSNLNEFAGQAVAISADATLPANSFVRVIQRLQAAGIAEIQLVAWTTFE